MAGHKTRLTLTPASGGSTSFILNEVEGLTTPNSSRGGIFELTLSQRGEGTLYLPSLHGRDKREGDAVDGQNRFAGILNFGLQFCPDGQAPACILLFAFSIISIPPHLFPLLKGKGDPTPPLPNCKFSLTYGQIPLNWSENSERRLRYHEQGFSGNNGFHHEGDKGDS